MDIFDSTNNNPFVNFTLAPSGSSITGDLTNQTTTAADFTLTVEQYPNPPDVNWMPYEYVMYDPLWHKKFAKIKYQMQTMWD